MINVQPSEKPVTQNRNLSWLTRICLEYFFGTSANSAEQDQTPQHAASDQVPRCLLIEVSLTI